MSILYIFYGVGGIFITIWLIKFIIWPIIEIIVGVICWPIAWLIEFITAISEERQRKALLNAVNMRDKETVQKLISNGVADMDGALNIAVENGDKEMVSLLIEKGVNVNFGNPIDVAKDEEIFALLKRHGAKTKAERDAEEAKRREEEEAEKKKEREEYEKRSMLTKELRLAVSNHDIDLAKSLISQGAYVNDNSGMQGTPLMFAIRADDIEMVKLLLKNGADARQEVYGLRGKINAIAFARVCGNEHIADFLEQWEKYK